MDEMYPFDEQLSCRDYVKLLEDVHAHCYDYGFTSATLSLSRWLVFDLAGTLYRWFAL